MKPYHKIETLLERGHDFKVQPGQWRAPEFEYLRDCCWVFTEKVDGTNVRVMWHGDTVNVSGRTDNAQMPPHLLKKLAELLPAEKFAAASLPELCLYGEGFGAKIQKGGDNYIADGCSFVLFDVRVGEVWLERENVGDIAGKLGIDVVPIVGRGTLPAAIEVAHKGFFSHWGDFPAEGLVVRPLVELYVRQGRRIIGKIKARDF